MKLSQLKKELDFSLGKDEEKSIKENSKKLFELIKGKIKSMKIDADVFLGGSFAKGTLMKSDEYDVDIFVRFNWKYEELSDKLEKLLKTLKKEGLVFERIHGSRDYFRLTKGNLTLEVIPVTKINSPKEARNVTDLSYFHVGYVRKNANDKIKKEIILAKAFAKSQNVYGAESYIGGFSGYALECLVIYYGSFEKMLKEIVKSERIIIDPKKYYKNKSDILINMNESKLRSPVIIVDPTWKERNVTAALSNEVYEAFRKAARDFIKKPGISYFKKDEFSEAEFKKECKSDEEFLHLVFETDKQPGDIAGTKMKKFSKFLIAQLGKFFLVKSNNFKYSLAKTSDFYLILKSKGSTIFSGPPVEMKKSVEEFKKAHPKFYERSGRLYAEIKIDFTAKAFLEKFCKDKKEMISSMGIKKISFA